MANLPGLKTRILAELEVLVNQRGWDPVRSYGSAQSRHEAILRGRKENIELMKEEADDKVSEHLNEDGKAVSLPAGLQDPELDIIDKKLAHTALR